MLSSGKTDIGRVRPKNEDTIFVSDSPVGRLENLYIVADGMGGHKAGQVASNTAKEAFLSYISKCQPDTSEEPLDMLIGAINMANEAVYSLSLSYEEYSNMGTTMVAATISGNSMYIAHVGDSRLYRISDGKIEQITNDHSLVAEMVRSGRITEAQARVHPQRNCITKAVGTDPSVVSDGIILKIKQGDVIVMCSDGLNTMLEDEKILETAISPLSAEERVGKLIDEANEKGGYDNISVIIIDV